MDIKTLNVINQVLLAEIESTSIQLDTLNRDTHRHELDHLLNRYVELSNAQSVVEKHIENKQTELAREIEAMKLINDDDDKVIVKAELIQEKVQDLYDSINRLIFDRLNGDC